MGKHPFKLTRFEPTRANNGRRRVQHSINDEPYLQEADEQLAGEADAMMEAIIESEQEPGAWDYPCPRSDRYANGHGHNGTCTSGDTTKTLGSSQTGGRSDSADGLTLGGSSWSSDNDDDDDSGYDSVDGQETCKPQDSVFTPCHDSSYQARLVDDLVDEGYGDLGISTFLAKSARRADHIQQAKSAKKLSLSRHSRRLQQAIDNDPSEAWLLQHGFLGGTSAQKHNSYLLHNRMGKLSDSESRICRQEDLHLNREKQDKARLHTPKLNDGWHDPQKHSDDGQNWLASSKLAKRSMTGINENQNRVGKLGPDINPRVTSTRPLQAMPSIANRASQGANESGRGPIGSKSTKSKAVSLGQRSQQDDTGQPCKSRTMSSSMHYHQNNKGNLPPAAPGPPPRYETTKTCSTTENIELPLPILLQEQARPLQGTTSTLPLLDWQSHEARKLLGDLKARSRAWRVRHSNLATKGRGRFSYVRRRA